MKGRVVGEVTLVRSLGCYWLGRSVVIEREGGKERAVGKMEKRVHIDGERIREGWHC